MRPSFLFPILLLPLPVSAWEFRPDPVCTLVHATAKAAITITFDPSVPEYRLDLDLKGEAFAPSPSFGIAFRGARGLTIGTDRHRITGSTLTVTDTGFGNVLDGLEFNRSASAFTATQSVDFPLDGAAGPVGRFRRYTEAAPATS